VSVLATIAGAAGFAFAAVGWDTGGRPRGAGFAYVVVVDNLVRVLRPQWIPWLFAENARLFLLGPSNDLPYLGRSEAGAGAYLVFVSLPLLGAATVVFRTRDVN
jgi:hypothetical protein